MRIARLRAAGPFPAARRMRFSSALRQPRVHGDERMKDKWYGDNGDLVKWSALLHLADRYGAARVLQIAYYRPSSWGRIKVGDDEVVIRPEVLAHFKDVRSAGAIRSRAKIAVRTLPQYCSSSRIPQRRDAWSSLIRTQDSRQGPANLSMCWRAKLEPYGAASSTEMF